MLSLLLNAFNNKDFNMTSKKLSRIFIALAVFFIITLAVGSFWDFPIAQALYRKGNTAAMVISFIGFILFFGICTVFLGVLFRQLLSSGKKTSFKILIVFAFIYLYVSTATLTGAGVLNDPLFENLFAFQVSFMTCLLAGTLIYIPLFVFGMLINGNRYEKKVVKKSFELVIIMTLVFLLSTYFNCTIIRPHFRLLQNGTGFEPWYHLENNGKLFMSISDLISAHPGSFISGHAMYGILFLILFPSLSLVFPSLQGKEKLLMFIGGLLGIVIIISRMITGDNYLSDIALGAISAIKMCFSYNALPKRKGIIAKFKDKVKQ